MFLDRIIPIENESKPIENNRTRIRLLKQMKTQNSCRQFGIFVTAVKLVTEVGML